MSDKASFDEIVELVSTGQADRIPGIKDIPLKINESEPSTATMQRPLKPWERESGSEETPTDSSTRSQDDGAAAVAQQTGKRGA